MFYASHLELLQVIVGILLIQPVLRPPQQATSDVKSTITGVVIGAEREPIRDAKVTLLVATSGQPRNLSTDSGISFSDIAPVVYTDGRGKFVLKNVDVGTYNLIFSAPGYVSQEYGQRQLTGAGTPIRIESNKSVPELTMRMTPTGNVNGRITDSDGRPAVGIQIQLLQANYNSDGRRVFHSGGTARTNDRGEYRLYWVTPGKYYLTAVFSLLDVRQPAALRPVLGGSLNEVQEFYRTTFYPGVFDDKLATTIEVMPSVDLKGFDMMIGRQALHNVRVRAVDSQTGKAPKAASISVVCRDILGASVSAGGPDYNSADGMFELRNLPTGSCRVVVTVQQTISNSSGGSAVNASGGASIDISDKDVETTVTIAPPRALIGRVVIEGLDRLPTNKEGESIGIRLLSANGTPVDPSLMVSHSLDSDGRFRIENVKSGEYWVDVFPKPADSYVKQVSFEGTDVLREPLRFIGTETGTLDILLGTKGGTLGGVALDDKLKPVANAIAVLIPTSEDSRSERPATT
jgi:hypothetical protein